MIVMPSHAFPSYLIAHADVVNQVTQLRSIHVPQSVERYPSCLKLIHNLRRQNIELIIVIQCLVEYSHLPV